MNNYPPGVTSADIDRAAMCCDCWCESPDCTCDEMCDDCVCEQYDGPDTLAEKYED